MSLLDIIPGYRDAVEAEQRDREAAFFPCGLTLCGLPVREFALAHFAILDGIGSPFLRGGLPTAEDVVRFLWVVSEEFDAGNKARLQRFSKRCRKLDYGQAVGAIQRYVDDAFADAPSGGQKRGDSAPIVGYCAMIVDIFAHEYGWHEEQVLRCPFKRIFQYLRLIQRRGDPKALFWSRSDQVKSDYLQTLNDRNRLNGN